MATRNLLVRAGFDARGLRSGVMQGNRYLGQFGTMANSTLGKFGKMMATAFAVSKIVQFGKECVNAGSDLAEVQNVVDTVFGSMADNVNQFAKTAITQFGISETACKQYTSTMGAMLKSMGLGQKDVLTMSKNMTALAADMASFYNLDADDAFAKIRSGISGETEPLKQLGINMSVANLQAYALSKGIKTSYQNMTQAQQALLRYNYLLSVTGDAQGDFARTSDSWANQTRVLNEQFNALKATLGQALIQMLTPAIKLLNTLVQRLQQAANYFNAFTAAAFGKQQAAAGVAQVKDDTDAAADSMENLGDTTAEAAKKATKAMAGFDEVNTLTKTADNTDVAGLLGDTDNVDISSIPDDTSKAADDTEKLKNAVDGLKEAAKPLIETAKESGKTFKDNFVNGLDKVNWSSIKKGLDSIGKSMKDIFSDKGLQQAAKNMVVTYSGMLGSLYGNTVAVAGNITDGLINGIADGLDKKKQVIASRLTDTFNNISKMNISAANIFSDIGDISKVFSAENARSIWSSITQILIDTCTTGLDLGSKIGADIVGGIETILTNNKSRIYDVFNNTFGVVAQIFDTLKNTVSNICQHILDVYDAKVSPAIGTFMQTISDFGGCLLDLYNNWVAPAFSEIADKVDDCFSKHLQPAIDSAIDFLGQFAESVANVLKYWEPVFEFLANILVPFLVGEFKRVMKTVIDIINVIIDVIKDIFNALSGVLQFLEGVFTGDWDKAWAGIKKTFGSLWQGVEDIAVGVFKVIKGWIDGIMKSTEDMKEAILEAMSLRDKKNAQNDLETYKGSFTDKGLQSLEKMSDEQRRAYIDRAQSEGLMPEGADEWIMNLPHYASGGLINREQLAVLGEGGRKEAVIPLEDSGFMDQLGVSIANAINASGQYNAHANTPLNITLNVDGRSLAKATVPYIPEQSRRLGVKLGV